MSNRLTGLVVGAAGVVVIDPDGGGVDAHPGPTGLPSTPSLAGPGGLARYDWNGQPVPTAPALAPRVQLLR